MGFLWYFYDMSMYGALHRNDVKRVSGRCLTSQVLKCSVMDLGLVAQLASAVALGWLIRSGLDTPIPERPCSCACACHCVSSIGGGTWLAVVAFLFLLVLVGWGWALIWLKKGPEQVVQPSPKGRKGVYGVTGKILSLTG